MEFIKFERQDNVGIVSLNRKPVNALTSQVYQEITQVFDRINKDKKIETVILKNEGEYFSVGNDINEFLEWNSENIEAEIGEVNDAILAIKNCRVPVISLVRGAAYGAGCIFVAVSDVIIADETASFSIPEIKVCLVGGTKDLARMLPYKLVRYMVLTGEPIGAKQIESYGGIYKVVSKDKLMETGMQVAAEITSNSPLAVELTKKTLNNYDLYDIPEAVDLKYSKILIDHPDAKESANAFLEKREPKFTRVE